MRDTPSHHRSSIGGGGRVAVVTGGSTGIGRATVAALARDGVSVVYCSHDPDTVGAAERELAEFGTAVTGTTADVRSADDMHRLMDLAADRYGGLDMLVCCAGVQTYGTVEDTTEHAWHTVIDTNLTGAFLAAKFAVPHLRARHGGSIVNVSSVQGHTPQPRVLGYSVSKAGLDALTRSMAVDHATDGIRVNSVAPGPVLTPLVTVDGSPDDGRPAARPPDPPVTAAHGRMAQPHEIAAVVAFLCSSSASYITGTTVVVDAGMLATPGRVLLST
ncbi:SDR family NAD(P)-dependent oxidoreductase [Microlunatus sp. Gsoil 973]|uniref:SDR family NAD(P)-dependent oxidoreductase n=1 Tax=Microlunatus sp. Gsoil 973 TaxID=2672569 RepID=UPI0012B4EA4F|nr:SDR family oxidoreductase [Microlunatus sp. Gsoil 973]QGN33923.1 SDR family oxidoreductase [Microlunatus sp. Gsoil 973]